MNDPVGGQAPEASIESRISSALFGTPKAKPAPAPQPQMQQPEPEVEQEAAPEVAPDGEGDTPPEVPQEETFELEVDGVKYALPKPLEKAVQQQKDYTQKTMELAEQRRTFELLHEQARIANMRQEFESSVSQELAQLQAYDAVLRQPVDWNSLDTNEAFRKKLQIDQWKDERDAILKGVQAKHQEFTAKQEAALKDFKSKAQEAVSKKIPNWSEATQKAIRDHAMADGYTEAELNSVSDPRMTLTLWKAAQFDQLKAKATPAVSAVKSVKTTPSNPMPQHVKDKFAFNKALAKAPPGSQQHKQLVEQRVGSLFRKG